MLANLLGTLMEVLGFVLVVGAAFMVSLPLALLVAGIGLIVAANVLTTRRPTQ